MDKRDGRGVIGWLVAAWLLLVFASLSCALEINRGEDGYETPMAAVASVRDSTSPALPLELDYWAPLESDLANLDIWLFGLHTNGDSTWAKTCQDTLRIVRVYR